MNQCQESKTPAQPAKSKGGLFGRLRSRKSEKSTRALSAPVGKWRPDRQVTPAATGPFNSFMGGHRDVRCVSFIAKARSRFFFQCRNFWPFALIYYLTSIFIAVALLSIVNNYSPKWR